MSKFVPKNYPQVIPYFIVDDAQRLIEFIKTVLEAEQIEKHLNEKGQVEHAAYKIGDGLVELSDASERFPARTNTIHLYVPDTDGAYKKALAAGAVSLYQPEDMPYGERSAGVEDPFGNYWFFATWNPDSLQET